MPESRTSRRRRASWHARLAGRSRVQQPGAGGRDRRAVPRHPPRSRSGVGVSKALARPVVLVSLSVRRDVTADEADISPGVGNCRTACPAGAYRCLLRSRSGDALLRLPPELHPLQPPRCNHPATHPGHFAVDVTRADNRVWGRPLRAGLLRRDHHDHLDPEPSRRRLPCGSSLRDTLEIAPRSTTAMRPFSSSRTRPASPTPLVRHPRQPRLRRQLTGQGSARTG